MTRQLLIYERAVPVSKQRHADWSVKAGRDFAFAKHVNSVPLTAVEIPAAAMEYPIVFAGTDDAVMPAIIVGVRDRENVYVDDDGKWDARYLPAFVRRYPFVFSSTDEARTFTLCIDEEFSGCNDKGIGERLFDAEGEHTQYLERVLEFLKLYQAQFQRTQAFCKRLRELDLLEPMQASFRTPAGDTMALTGFQSISRDRLKALSGDVLEEMARRDELELAYTQMQSMRNIGQMAQRLGTALASPADVPTTDQDAAPPVAADDAES